MLHPIGGQFSIAVVDALPPNPSRVLSSAFLRARETAKPYCERVGVTAEVQPLLNEFSALDPALIDGMNGAQRRPIANAYWEAADPAARMGERAETFLEFNARVQEFLRELPALPDISVVFGHGIWFGLLCCSWAVAMCATSRTCGPSDNFSRAWPWAMARFISVSSTDEWPVVGSAGTSLAVHMKDLNNNTLKVTFNKSSS